MVDTVRGALRVRAWPKKRGKPKHPHTQYMNRWFRDAMKRIKFIDPQQRDIAIKWTRNTGLYPRDIVMAASTSGLFKIPDPDQGVLEFKRKGLYEVAFQGGINQLTAPVALAPATFTKVLYPLALVDTAAMWDPSPQSRWVIPKGVNIVNVSAHHFMSGGGIASNWSFLQLNGGPLQVASSDRAANSKYCSVTWGPVQVQEGDFFEHFVQCQVATTLFATETMFQIEILDANFPPGT